MKIITWFKIQQIFLFFLLIHTKIKSATEIQLLFNNFKIYNYIF